MKNKKLLMIPGPSPVTRSIQNELGRETVAFGDPAFVAGFKELLSDLKTLWHTTGEVFVVAGSGTLAMEMAIANSTKRGDNVLVVSHGYFGNRFTEICTAKGLQVDVLESSWGSIVTPETIASQLSMKHYSVVTVTHVDTSTGVSAPIEEIGKIVSRHHDTLSVVDGVCATGGEREYIDEMNIDLLLTGSQKAFGVPPGIAVVWAGERALARRKELGIIPEYYCDFNRWLPIMHDPSKYFATPPVNMIWAMKEALSLIKNEGLDRRIVRHKKFALALQAAMEELGFRILAEQGCRASTLSCLLYPEGVDDMSFRSILAEEGVQVAGGIGAYAGKMFRLGHMGNIDTHDLVSVVGAIERTLHRLGRKVEFGKAAGILQQFLTRTDTEL